MTDMIKSDEQVLKTDALGRVKTPGSAVEPSEISGATHPALESPLRPTNGDCFTGSRTMQ
jgi:hypothetical protein